MREENNPCADYAVTSDFLEAWLNLAERLIDTESVIDSAHSIHASPEGKKPKTGVWFDPLVFVIKAQKVRVHAIVCVFNTYVYMYCLNTRPCVNVSVPFLHVHVCQNPIFWK